MTDARPYVSVVSLATQDNAKMIQELKSDFQRKINWEKYQSKVQKEREKQYIEYWIDSSLQ